MDCLVLDNHIVLIIILLLIYSLSGMSVVSFIFNNNMIMLIMLFVVASIFTFVLYYMRRDVSSDSFKLLKVLFLGLIIFILSSYGLLIFIGWEGIGVISIMLIGYWIRPIAKSGAISAIIYNRWGDLIFLVFMFICREIIMLLLLFAVMCKSSLYLYQY